MSGTAIIDATTTTVVSLQSFLGSGLPLSDKRSGGQPAPATSRFPTPELVHSLSGTDPGVKFRRYQGQLQQVGNQILADMDRKKAVLMAADDVIDTARGILNDSLHTLQHYRRAAQDLSCRPFGGRQISDRLQMVVCGAVVRGALDAFDSITYATGVDAARLRAMSMILTEVLRQFISK